MSSIQKIRLRQALSCAAWLLICFSFWHCHSPEDASLKIDREVSFNFDVQPILSENCFVCHGPDSSSREAGLRLDIRTGAIAQLPSGNRAVVPGNWRRSELIRRVSSHDTDYAMPPAETNRRLDKQQIAILKKWIQDGAEWQPYWAFQPIVNPPPPSPAEGDQTSGNEIDNFLLAKMEEMNLDPVGLTSHNKLIRRLSYVLTGLPPDPQIIAKYGDTLTESQYLELVDHYLESPHFGEHWARHWMDLVRYADTRGHEFDYEILGAWRYRDYLIRAFNQDVPYNQLVLEHLAGDLLEKPRKNQVRRYNESVLGTAFYCLTEGKHSPVDIKEDESERIDNIIDVTGKTFLGLTIGCAKCHDHKFDPIPTTDYYSLYGIFESTRFSLIPAGLDGNKLEILDSLHRDHKGIRDFIASKLTYDDQRQESTTMNLDPGPEIRILGDFRTGGLQGWTVEGLAFENALGVPVIENNRLVGLEEGKVSSKTKGRGLQGAVRSPNFIIEQDSLLLRAAGGLSEIRIIIDNFQLIQDPIYGQLSIQPDSEEMEDYKVDLSMWKGHKAYIELLSGSFQPSHGRGYHKYYIDPDAWLEVAYTYSYDSLTQDPFKSTTKVLNLNTAWKNWQSNNISPYEVRLLDKYFEEYRPFLSGIEEQVKSAHQKREALYDSTHLVGVTDGDQVLSSVFIRGSHTNLSQYQVPHRFLTSLGDTTREFSSSGSGRLELARSIVDPANPLTARVMVNRIWHHVFGKGIVETVDNFGLQGKLPTHPELLDFLATRFMEQGWSIKTMIRYLVSSQAFRRSSDPLPDVALADPNNQFWHYYPVRRLTAESIRDAILTTSGSLDKQLYGPTVPVYLTKFLKGRGRPSQSGPLDGEGRRSIYQRLMRNFLPPMMLAFDMPIPFTSFGQRNTSNVPAQSLTLLNDPFVSEQAGHWASKIINSHSDFTEKVKNVYIKAFARKPTAEEMEEATSFFEEQRKLYADQTNLEWILWKDYCHSVYNMKEFIFLI